MAVEDLPLTITYVEGALAIYIIYMVIFLLFALSFFFSLSFILLFTQIDFVLGFSNFCNYSEAFQNRSYSRINICQCTIKDCIRWRLYWCNSKLYHPFEAEKGQDFYYFQTNQIRLLNTNNKFERIYRFLPNWFADRNPALRGNIFRILFVAYGLFDIFQQQFPRYYQISIVLVSPDYKSSISGSEDMYPMATDPLPWCPLHINVNTYMQSHEVEHCWGIAAKHWVHCTGRLSVSVLVVSVLL